MLVLVPTRELAVQVSEAMFSYGRELGVKVVPVFGGQPIQRQLQALDRGVHVVVATPGRALDHIGRGSLALDAIRTVILDEADEMLDMGFTDDIESILESTPDDRQTVLFSATMPSRITSIAKRYQKDPARITIGRTDAAPGSKALVRQTVYVVQRAHKPSALGRILDIEAPKSALVFCRTRTEVDQLTETMNGRGYRAEALHGGMDQTQRDRVMGRLRDGTAELLVATDVAARGLDIDTLTHVVNYDVPSAAESYVHRIGRVGRAGREGVAITLAEPRERRGLENIERLTKQKFEIATVPTVSDLRARQIELTVTAVREALAAVDLEDFNVVLHALVGRGQRPQHRARRDQAGARVAWGDHRRARDPRRLGQAPRAGKQGAEARDGKGKKFEGKNRNAGERDRGGNKGQRAGGAGTGFVHVSLGRKAGVRPGDLVGAIANETGLVGRDIGPIRISESVLRRRGARSVGRPRHRDDAVDDDARQARPRPPLRRVTTRPPSRLRENSDGPSHRDSPANAVRAAEWRSAAEVLEVAAGGRAALALVLGAGGAAAVGPLGRGGHLHEADLADLHARVERDRQAGDVGEFEGDVPVEAGVDEPGGRVDQQAEPAERRLALDPADEVVGDTDAFERRAEHELAGMQDERFLGAGRDLDELGEVDHVELHVDHAAGVVAEDPEQVRDPHVDRRRLDQRFVERVDHDPTGSQLFAKGAVGEDHESPR